MFCPRFLLHPAELLRPEVLHLLTILSVFQDVSLPSLPSVVVFKDGTYFTFNGEKYSHWWLVAPGGPWRPRWSLVAPGAPRGPWWSLVAPGGPWWLAPVKLTQCYQSNPVLAVLEQQDGELKAWMNGERFPTYSKIDSYSLYAMGESGNVSSVPADG